MNFRIYSTSFVVHFSRGTANLYSNLQINLHGEIARISQRDFSNKNSSEINLIEFVPSAAELRPVWYFLF